MTLFGDLANQLPYEKTVIGTHSYSTFCQIIHKQNAHSKELWNCSPIDKNTFYQTVFREEFTSLHSSKGNLTDTLDSQYVVKLFLYIFITSFSSPTPKIKFDYLKSIQNNTLLNDETKNLFFRSFCFAQKHYWLLNRLSYSHKVRRMATRSQEDLYLRPISATDKDVITVIDRGQKYLFTKRDIYKLFYSSLIHSEFPYEEPYEMKNPYNNLPFGKSVLTYIYFFLKKQLLVMPAIMDAFFLCDFDLSRFESEYQILLRDTILNEFLDSPGEIDKKCAFIRRMFSNIDFKRIIIDNDFPKKTLLDIMKPYLRLYLFAEYTLDRGMRICYKNELYMKLRQFTRLNPRFGRKYVVLKKNSVFDFPTTFSLDSCPSTNL